MVSGRQSFIGAREDEIPLRLRHLWPPAGALGGPIGPMAVSAAVPERQRDTVGVEAVEAPTGTKCRSHNPWGCRVSGGG